MAPMDLMQEAIHRPNKNIRLTVLTRHSVQVPSVGYFGKATIKKTCVDAKTAATMAPLCRKQAALF